LDIYSVTETILDFRKELLAKCSECKIENPCRRHFTIHRVYGELKMLRLYFSEVMSLDELLKYKEAMESKLKETRDESRRPDIAFAERAIKFKRS
jgi:hypothetical protein